MPNVQQKKFNSGAIVALVFVAAIIGSFFLPVDFWLKTGIGVLLVLLFIFIRRGYIYYYRAAVLFKKGQNDKVWNCMEKALKAGVDFDRKVGIGSAYIQVGEPRRGIEILENVISDPKAGSFAQSAAVTVSMGYWRLGDAEKAIQILEDLKETGYRDENLSINLEAYLLVTGKVKKAKELINERKKEGIENNGLMDNRGWYYIQSGNWEKAKEVYDELIDDRMAKFPEAYLHGAQVSVHFGDIAQAVDRLGWGISKRFSKICLTSKAYMEQLSSGLENPRTREAFAKAMDASYVDVSDSRPFDGFDNILPLDEDDPDVLRPAEEGAGRTAALSVSSEVERDIVTDVDDDDRVPNTDLDDEDEALAAKLGYSEPEPAELPHTDIGDDDDDRVPNTDLDEDE